MTDSKNYDDPMLTAYALGELDHEGSDEHAADTENADVEEDQLHAGPDQGPERER